MKKTILLITPFLFIACFSTTKIYTIHDDFKNEKKVYIKHYKSLKPLETYDVYIASLATIIWQVKEGNNTVKKELLFEIDLEPALVIDSTFYIRTSDKIVQLKFNKITSSKVSRSFFEEDKKQKNDSLTIITKTEHHEIKTHFKATSSLQKDVVNTIIQSETLLLRVYIDDKAYDVNYSKKELASIKTTLLNL